jgi:hypothetical protein
MIYNDRSHYRRAHKRVSQRFALRELGNAEVRDSLQISHGGVDREEPPVFPEADTRSAVNRRAFQNSYIVAADSTDPSEKTARREETFNFWPPPISDPPIGRHESLSFSLSLSLFLSRHPRWADHAIP